MYKIGELFDITSSKKKFDANKVTVMTEGKYPYVVRLGSNNGQKGFIDEAPIHLNEGNTISFGQDTATVYYQETPYFTGDKIKILHPKKEFLTNKNAQFILAALNNALKKFSWGDIFNTEIIKEIAVWLPTSNGNSPDYGYMDFYIAELEAQRIAELEAYLTVSGLDDYVLTKNEQEVLENCDCLYWQEYNLEELFGKSTRGKRLKSDDRIYGTLPFVTAGETDEGISAFIGNDVQVFPKNTTTIDMFGSAKYRNYYYGGDDHVAVVHTEKLPMDAAIFVTAAIHKSAHNGQFNYGHNFYAKDADALNILLPSKDGKPDYETMETLISAVRKMVIKGVVEYANEKIALTQDVIER